VHRRPHGFGAADSHYVAAIKNATFSHRAAAPASLHGPTALRAVPTVHCPQPLLLDGAFTYLWSRARQHPGATVPLTGVPALRCPSAGFRTQPNSNYTSAQERTFTLSHRRELAPPSLTFPNQSTAAATFSVRQLSTATEPSPTRWSLGPATITWLDLSLGPRGQTVVPQLLRAADSNYVCRQQERNFIVGAATPAHLFTRDRTSSYARSVSLVPRLTRRRPSPNDSWSLNRRTITVLDRHPYRPRATPSVLIASEAGPTQLCCRQQNSTFTVGPVGPTISFHGAEPELRCPHRHCPHATSNVDCSFTYSVSRSPATITGLHRPP